jgi:hypothetical protein
MADLLAEDDGPVRTTPKAAGLSRAMADEDVAMRRPGQTSPLPRLFRSRVTQQPLPGHPLAQASERSKDRLMGGKGVRFDEPRKYMGVLIAFLVLAGGYAGFLGFSAFWNHYSNVAEHRAKTLEKQFKQAEAAKKKRFEDAVRAIEAKQAPKQDNSTAGKAGPAAGANTAHLAVAIESVRQGVLFPPDQREFCEVKLRITNESKVASYKAAWPGPNVQAMLRDAMLNRYQVLQPPARDATIASGESVQDTLYFERTVPGQTLTLELTIPQGTTTTKTKLQILPSQIQKGP